MTKKKDGRLRKSAVNRKKPDAVEAAVKIVQLLSDYPPDIADKAIEFVWFFRLGKLLDWSMSYLKQARD